MYSYVLLEMYVNSGSLRGAREANISRNRAFGILAYNGTILGAKIWLVGKSILQKLASHH